MDALPSFRRTHSADPKRSGPFGGIGPFPRKLRGRDRSQSKPTVLKTRSVPATDAIPSRLPSMLSVYSFTSQRDGKMVPMINVNKTKQRLLHAKSREIPQHQFSSSLVEHQDEESNTYQYLASITHFDINTLRLLHLRFNRIDALSARDRVIDTLGDGGGDAEEMKAESRSNGKLDINAMAKLFGLPPHCLLVRCCTFLGCHAHGAML